MAEQGPTLGEYLRQAREQRGITIEQVASATKIGVRLLHSLEADHYADLPARPFIRGFVTSYARFIGLDPREILTRYSSYLDERAHDRPNREGGHSGYAFERKEGEQSRMILGIVMGGFVLVGGLLIFFLKPSLHHHRGSHLDKLRAAHPELDAAPSTLPSPTDLVPSPIAAPIAAPVGVALPSPSPSPLKPSPTPKPLPKPKPPEATPSPTPLAVPSPLGQPVAQKETKPDPLNSGTGLLPKEIREKVIFTALANAWVRYQVDDRPMMKFVLKKGKLLVLRAVHSIRFQISNPHSILLNHNGHKASNEEILKVITMRQNNATLIFPAKISASFQEPFPGEKPLPQTPDPVPDSSTIVPNSSL